MESIRPRPGAIRVRIAGIALVGVALAAMGPHRDAADAGVRYRVSARKIVGGLKLITVTDTKLGAEAKVLKVEPSSVLTVDIALATGILPGREKTSSLVARHGAIAGINASIGTSWGRPLGIFAEDGSLKSSPIAKGAAFAIDKAETNSYVGYHELRIVAKNLNTGAAWRVVDWNDQYPNRDRISVYTSAGGDVVKPPRYSCAVRVKPDGPMTWGRGQRGIWRAYRVDRKQCGDDRLGLHGGIVFAARTGSRGAKKLMEVRKGHTMRVKWELMWPGVMDVVAGSPILMQEGLVVVEQCDGYVCQRHPRTGVGATAAGKILLVTVDGRQSDSAGMTVVEFARFFRWLGADRALNLDGGGSTTMVLEGEVINDPSDPAGERPVTSGLLVLPGADAKELTPLPPR
ncbi:MAG: phosphodiester glycosidase family protein [Actinomycetota bacterium]|nr:phosphodiester glycosidase family protein [Actinomycetota bacterium]